MVSLDASGLMKRALEGLRESSDEGAGGLAGALGAVVANVERWRHAAAISSMFRTLGRDVVTAPHQRVELTVDVGTLTRLRASRVAVLVDDVRVGDAEVGSHPVRIPYVPAAPGLHRVSVEALDSAGTVVAGSLEEELGLLQVVGQVPVAAVDVELLFDDPTHLAEPLGRLAAAGWSVCYLDTHFENRLAVIRPAIQRLGLPAGAVLMQPRDPRPFSGLPVDFGRAFAAIALRRARAHGVGVAMLISARPLDVGIEGLEPVAPGDVAGQVGRARGTATRWRARRDDLEDDLHRRLDDLTGAALVPGNELAVDLDNRAARERVFALVESAERSIHLQTYIFGDGPFADHLSARLVARAHAGVRVRLLVDALYSTQGVLGMQNRVLTGLGAVDGVTVVARDAIEGPAQLDARALKHRDHRKLLIVDGSTAVVGGRNVGDEYYTGFDEVAITDWTPSPRVPWLDAHAVIRGPLVADIQRAFARAWEDETGETSDGPDWFPPIAPAGPSSARVVLHDGVGDMRSLGLHEALLESARDEIVIVNDFPVMDELAERLRDAVRRGVQVTVLTGCAVARRGDGQMLRGPAHRQAFEYMTKHRFADLVRLGVDVLEFVAPPNPLIVCTGGRVRPYVHAKMVLCDSRVLAVGSANLDTAASFWEREASVVLHDEELAARVRAELQPMIDGAHRIRLDAPEWRREAGHRELAARLWPTRMYS